MGKQDIDERTQKYFAAIRENMGFIGSNAGWDGIQDILKKKGVQEPPEKIATYTGYVNSSDIEVYTYTRDGRERYCAELSYQTAIDDYCTETHIFSKMPSERDVSTIRTIGNLEFKIAFEMLKTRYTCWECGNEVHWLDNSGSFDEKVNGLLDRYCGC